MPASALVSRPHRLPAVLRPTNNAPLPYPLPKVRDIPGFGDQLSPVELSAQPRLTSELLRTL
jgi:hypothetical protein